MKILVTGGAGFIGSHFVDLVMSKGHDVVVLDKLTYAGRQENLQKWVGNAKFTFVKGDICDEKLVMELTDGCDSIANFAAETHVDRSLDGRMEFVDTEVAGVLSLLKVCRERKLRMLQVSTDEVYGQVLHGYAKEDDRMAPRNPYSVCKTAAEMMCFAYVESYGVDVVVTRSCNNVGPRQHPEKFMPRMITYAISGKQLPVFGQGRQRRDWIWVGDNCEGLFSVLSSGKSGHAYNVTANQEEENIVMARRVLFLLQKSYNQLSFVADRPGHDFRYAMDASKVKGLGWKPSVNLNEAVIRTVRWYAENKKWWDGVIA